MSRKLEKQLRAAAADPRIRPSHRDQLEAAAERIALVSAPRCTHCLNQIPRDTRQCPYCEVRV